MDENAIEKSKEPAKDIIRRISREEFEEKLFSGGVYHFDFDRDARELKMDVVSFKAWCDNNPLWDEKRKADSLAIDVNDARYEFSWRNQFDGQIPKSWLNWMSIRDDFEEAQKLGLQLSDDLINAGITHPLNIVANTVGKSQRLNMTQLVAVLARPNIAPWNEQEIISAQITKGLTQTDLREAQRRAEKIKVKMVK